MNKLGVKQGITVVMAMFIVLFSAFAPLNTPLQLEYPEYWPDPVYDFSENPLTLEGVELGRMLFYDPVFSIDSTISCSRILFPS